MHNVDSQCTGRGREEAKGQRQMFMPKFFLSCHKILILFHSLYLHKLEGVRSKDGRQMELGKKAKGSLVVCHN